MKASFYNMEIDIADQSENTMGLESFDPVKTPYELDEHEFPRDGSLKEQFTFLLRYAILAPSSFGRERATADMNLWGQAPGLIVLYGEDSVPVWLGSGELLQRLLLSITCQGLQYGFFNMPIEVPELRVQLRGLLGLSAWPQLLLSLGYCLTEPVPSPRRPIEEVIIESKPNFF